MATLKIISNFQITAQGRLVTGKQGDADDGFDDELNITVSGLVHEVISTLATAAVVKVWDDDTHYPQDFDYLYVWADQDVYVQVIGSGSNAIFKVEATVPFWLSGFDTILAAANTTEITGGTEPTLTDIDSVVLGNYSGSEANYHFAVFD